MNPKETAEELAFFNYHEFLVSNDTPVEQPLPPDADASSHGHSSLTLHDIQPARQTSNLQQTHQPLQLVVNHFPNPHTTKHSEVYQRTRIVRIPRVFDRVPLLDMVPQFSTYTPGKEPAALLGGPFRAAGSVDGVFFGESSATALVPQYMSPEELHRIIEEINRLLAAATTPSWRITVDNVLEFVTGTLYSRLAGQYTHMKRGMREVEQYVAEVNETLQRTHPDLKLILPVRSGLLLLDFQIPAPKNSTDR